MNTRYILSVLCSSLLFLSLSSQNIESFQPDAKAAKKGTKVNESGVASHQERLYFPILVSKDLSLSTNIFADAAMRFYASHETRQNYLSWFNENYPELGNYLSSEKSAIPGTEVALTIFNVNSKFIKAILEDSAFANKGGFPNIIDSLIVRNVFLGGDQPFDINTKKISEFEKEAQLFKSITAQSKPAIDREAVKSTEGHTNGQGKEIKEAFIAKARQRDAIFIDPATKAPVFLEANLLAEGVGEIDYRIYEFAFRWMIFANAYPELYQNVSGKVKEYIYKGDWFGLYTFSRENLNPSSFTNEVNYILNSHNL